MLDTTNHRNRGGGRHAVYVVRQEVLLRFEDQRMCTRHLR